VTLAEAQAAHQATEAAVQQAKAAYFATPDAKAKAGIVKAEAALADAQLELERAEHAATLARNAHLEADRHEREEELARLRTLDTERQAEIERAVAELVAYERAGGRLIAKIEQLSSERAVDFQTRKRLSLSLDMPTIVPPPPRADAARWALQAAIRRAQGTEGRDNRDAGAVSVWLQPADRVPPVAGITVAKP